MKRAFILLLISILIMPAYAQEFKGIAYFYTESNMQISFANKSSAKSDKDTLKVAIQEKELNARIRKSMQREYQLAFDTHASLYKEIPKLKGLQEEKGIEVVGLGGGAEGGLYKNTKALSYKESRDVFGKVFLVDDQLVEWDWKLEKETKQIGQYTCFKATAYKPYEGEKPAKPDITAWYTPQIPISQGPANYWGLPGFILEVEDYKVRISCHNITLNPEKEFTLSPPTKGKKVDRATFEKIYKEKVTEMTKMYQNQRKKS